MPKKRFSLEQIIATLRQIEVQLAQGKSVALACKDAAVSEQNYAMLLISRRFSTPGSRAMRARCSTWRRSRCRSARPIPCLGRR